MLPRTRETQSVMKKINFGIGNMLKALTIEQQKRITGGDGPGTKPECHDTEPCMLVYIDKYNVSTTYQGRCATGAMGCNCRLENMGTPPLTSNGGLSRCTKTPM